MLISRLTDCALVVVVVVAVAVAVVGVGVVIVVALVVIIVGAIRSSCKCLWRIEQCTRRQSVIFWFRAQEMTH